MLLIDLAVLHDVMFYMTRAIIKEKHRTGEQIKVLNNNSTNKNTKRMLTLAYKAKKHTPTYST